MIDVNKLKTKVGGVEVTTGAVLASDGSSEKNKTGGWRAIKPVTDRAKCTGCNICWVFCPDESRVKQSDGKYDANFDYCKGCGICAQVCPVKAITMVTEVK
jgi:pyruvate ferredoxin oxidoreductase delta subunit